MQKQLSPWEKLRREMERDPPTAGRANGLAVIYSLKSSRAPGRPSEPRLQQGLTPDLGLFGITRAECKLTASQLRSQKSFLGAEQRSHRLSEPSNHTAQASFRVFRVAALARRGARSRWEHGGPAAVPTLLSLNPDAAFLSSLLPLAFHPSASRRKRASRGLQPRREQQSFRVEVRPGRSR